MVKMYLYLITTCVNILKGSHGNKGLFIFNSDMCKYTVLKGDTCVRFPVSSFHSFQYYAV
jgi:hypothetical protein